MMWKRNKDEKKDENWDDLLTAMRRRTKIRMKRTGKKRVRTRTRKLIRMDED
jgi:hypothetical protein